MIVRAVVLETVRVSGFDAEEDEDSGGGGWSVRDHTLPRVLWIVHGHSPQELHQPAQAQIEGCGHRRRELLEMETCDRFRHYCRSRNLCRHSVTTALDDRDPCPRTRGLHHLRNAATAVVAAAAVSCHIRTPVEAIELSRKIHHGEREQPWPGLGELLFDKRMRRGHMSGYREASPLEITHTSAKTPRFTQPQTEVMPTTQHRRVLLRTSTADRSPQAPAYERLRWQMWHLDTSVVGRTRKRGDGGDRVIFPRLTAVTPVLGDTGDGRSKEARRDARDSRSWQRTALRCFGMVWYGWHFVGGREKSSDGS